MSTVKSRPLNLRLNRSWLWKGALVLAILAAFWIYRESKFSSYGTHHELVGTQATELGLPLFGNEEASLRLADYRGQVVLIDFWATWCGPCKRQMPRLRHVGGYFQNDDFALITVNVDEESRKRRGLIHRYLRANHIPFAVGLGDHKDQVTYDAIRIPTMILVGRDGTIRRHFGGMTTATHLKKAIATELQRPFDDTAENDTAENDTAENATSEPHDARSAARDTAP